MRKHFSVCLYTLIVLILLLVFREWFSSGLIASGDMGFLYKSMLFNHKLLPYAWYLDQGNGLGGISVPFLWIYFMGTVPVLFLNAIFGYQWSLIIKFAYLYPFLLLGLISIDVLIKYIFPKSKLHVLSALLYLISTYILMLIGGGQLQLALSYAITPLVFLLMILLFKTFKNPDKNSYFISVMAGIAIALQILSDFRFTYITFTALFLYSIGFIILNKDSTSTIWRYWKALFGFVIALCIPPLLHAFWLLPTVLIHSNPLKQLGAAYTTTKAVQYFSFAKFEDTMGLLHPNWPENVFGLTHFMRPEFLLLPILAFASLLFVKKTKDEKEQEQNRNILFFALLGLIGIFLAKGANDPFGGVYLWLFAHVPGFVMFRDPTKWYLLIAISYSMLIPFTVSQIYELIKIKAKFLSFRLLQGKFFNLQNLFTVLVVGYLLFLIRPALLGQLGGTFKTHTLPQDYVTFEKYMVSKDSFSRVLWIPSLERFGFYSPTHSAVGAEELYNVTSVPAVLQNLSEKQTQTFLQQRGIKYIVVPYDAEGELFVKDRKYDNTQYVQTIEFLKKVPWVREISGFGRVHVFQLAGVKDLFWVTNSSTTKVKYTSINPTKYILQISNAQKGDKLVFASTYDNHWQLTIGKKSSRPIPFEQSLNMFVFPQSGTYTATLYYTPQTWVNIGIWISGLTSIGIILFLVRFYIFKKSI